MINGGRNAAAASAVASCIHSVDAWRAGYTQSAVFEVLAGVCGAAESTDVDETCSVQLVLSRPCSCGPRSAHAAPVFAKTPRTSKTRPRPGRHCVAEIAAPSCSQAAR